MKNTLFIAILLISMSAFGEKADDQTCWKLDRPLKSIPLNLPKRLTDERDQLLFKKYFPKRRIELGSGAVTYCIKDTQYVTFLNFFNAKGEMVASLDGRFSADDYNPDAYSFNYDGEQGFAFIYEGKKVETRDVFINWYDVSTNYNAMFTPAGTDTFAIKFSCDYICRSWQR